LSSADAAGFVLAGGKSSRMGSDKALVDFAGRPLIARALAILAQAGLPAEIAGAGPSVRVSLETFAPVIEDSTPGLGPLSGICSALASSSALHAVFLPVDLPFLPPSLLVDLLHNAQTAGSAVTIASVSGFAQTFPAVIDRAALPALLNELRSGCFGCFAAFQAAAASLKQSVQTIALEPLIEGGQISDPRGRPPEEWFLNLNTQADLARAEALENRQ
jgi:molybdopterin-guanine dinucleotide biosynthesis protein A